MTVIPDLSRLVPNDRVQGPFLVLDVETHTGDHPHTVLILGNSSGTIPTAPFWAEERSKIAGITRRTIVQISGEIGTYRDPSSSSTCLLI